MKEPAKIGDAYQVVISFKIDGGNVPSDVYIIVDRMEVRRGTAYADLIACSRTSSEDVYRKCHNGDIQLPYETLNHLIQSNILELTDEDVTMMDIDDRQ